MRQSWAWSSMQRCPRFQRPNIRMIERRPQHPPPPSGSRGCLFWAVKHQSAIAPWVPVNQDVPLDGCWLFHHLAADSPAAPA